MVSVFSGKLPGVKDQDVIGKIHPASRPITVADTKYARSKSLYVKGIITGPSTLAHGLHISTSIPEPGGDCTGYSRLHSPPKPVILRLPE